MASFHMIFSVYFEIMQRGVLIRRFGDMLSLILSAMPLSQARTSCVGLRWPCKDRLCMLSTLPSPDKQIVNFHCFIQYCCGGGLLCNIYIRRCRVLLCVQFEFYLKKADYTCLASFLPFTRKLSGLKREIE